MKKYNLRSCLLLRVLMGLKAGVSTLLKYAFLHRFASPPSLAAAYDTPAPAHHGVIPVKTVRIAFQVVQKTIISLGVVGMGFTAHAGDIEAGKARSNTCVACHGSNGISGNPVWPNLAGQKEQYLVLQMKAFRDGERQNPLMTPMAQGLSDEDIDNLAAYYNSLSACP